MGGSICPGNSRMKWRSSGGDIIKLIPVKDGVQIKKVHLIEMGDKSPEAVEAFVHAAASAMSRESQMELAARLLNSLREEEKQ